MLLVGNENAGVGWEMRTRGGGIRRRDAHPSSAAGAPSIRWKPPSGGWRRIPPTTAWAWVAPVVLYLKMGRSLERASREAMTDLRHLTVPFPRLVWLHHGAPTQFP